MQEILRKMSKTEDRFTAKSEERASVQQGNRQLSREFLQNVYSP